MSRAKVKERGQLELPKVQTTPRRRDKNGGWRGGKRLGAGRKKRKRGPDVPEPHAKRRRVLKSEPQHIVLRSNGEVGSFRTPAVFQAIRAATYMAARYEDTFRIVEYSVQDNHVHLIVEANDKDSLARGMKAFGGSCSKHINAQVSRAKGWERRRRGSVFRDRYFVTALTTPRQVRNTLAYVLNNWRHHELDRTNQRRNIYPYASGISFDGWKELQGTAFVVPAAYDPPITSKPRTFLLRVLWKKKYPLISYREVPGGGLE